MEALGHTFDEVHPSLYDLEFIVSVIRIWEAPSRLNPNETQSFEMVVLDHKRIHVGVGKGLEKNGGLIYVNLRLELLDPPIFPLNPFRFRTVAEVLDEDVVLASDTFGILHWRGGWIPRTKGSTAICLGRWWARVFHMYRTTTPNLSLLLCNTLRFLGGMVRQRFRATLSYQRISQLDSDGALNGAEEIRKGKASVITIQQVGQSTKQEDTWIAVRIAALNVQGGGYGTGLHWFDHTIVMGKREAKQLCGKPSHEVIKELPEAEDDYPPSLNKMLDRKLLIKIHVKKSNFQDGDHVYPVVKIVEYEELVEKYMGTKKPITETSVDLDTTTNASFEVQRNIVNLISDSDPHFSLDALDESASTMEDKTLTKRACSPMSLPDSTPLSLESPITQQPTFDGDHSTNRGKMSSVKKQKFQLLDED
ncbi:hypothetical protein PIB30_057514 [Stylosanthes scabra]|uniref:Uncharacterized protein n=1 Tax=Stylosanthes scabra TaxID=79078 RepID=A0ABU6QK27_9FABA|nr:hypothetical protein [Stylosanthes scabra]